MENPTPIKIEPLWINRGKPIFSLDIEKAEKHYNAIYVGDFCIKYRNNWTERAVSVFFNETPSKPEYSQYFGLFYQHNSIMITDAISATEEPFTGIVSDSGEIIYSRYRHDFRESVDGTVVADGGRDYNRFIGHVNNPKVKLTIIREHIVVNDTLILPYSKP